MSVPHSEDPDTGASPGSWAILALVLAVLSFFLLFGPSSQIRDFLWRPTESAAESYRFVYPSVFLPPVMLGLGTVLAIMGMRLRTVLRSWGDRSGLPDAAGAGAMIAGPAATLGAVLGWIPLFSDYVNYETPHVEETFFLVIMVLWAFPLTVGIGLMCTAAVWSLRPEHYIGPVRAGLGKAAGVVALLTPITLLFAIGIGIALVGQVACLVWLMLMPRYSGRAI